MYSMTPLLLLLLSLGLIPFLSESKAPPGWTEQAPIRRGPRQERSVTALGTDIYLIGGIPDQQPYPTLDWVEVFSAASNEWRNASSLPTPMNHGNTATIDGKVYVLGGLNGSTAWTPNENSYEYQPETDNWETLPLMPEGTARGASAVGTYGSTIYLAGGLNELNLVTGAQPTVDTVTSYNTKTRKWTTLPSLPEGRDHVGGAVIGDTFYVVGGRLNGVPNVRNTVFAMDLSCSALKRVEKAAMPTARGGLSTAAVGRKIYTFGGEGNRAVSTGVFDNVEVYDTVSDSWERIPPMPFPRHGTNAASVGSRIYIPGGGNVTASGPHVPQARNDFYQT